jgi:hypothetical protein
MWSKRAYGEGVVTCATQNGNALFLEVPNDKCHSCTALESSSLQRRLKYQNTNEHDTYRRHQAFFVSYVPNSYRGYLIV